MQPINRKPAIHTPDGYEADKEEDETKLPRCEYFTRYPSTSIYNADVKRTHHYFRSDDGRHYSESKSNKNEIKFIPYPLTLRNRDKARVKLVKYLDEKDISVELPKDDALVTIDVPTTGKNKKKVIITGLATISKSLFDSSKLDNLSTEPEEITFSELLDAIKLEKKDKIGNTIAAHTGGFANPYHLEEYAKNIDLQFDDTTKFPLNSIVYNDLLEYKKSMCKYIVDKYAEQMSDKGKVSFSNEYPCVLVRFNYNTDNKSATADELKNTFFKRYNYMLMAYFIAIVDYHAFKAGIEIEMVARPSFGHNNPTIDVTGKSFRINIGLIPKVYADIIVDSFIKLYNLFDLLENPNTIHLVMNTDLRTRLNLGRPKDEFDEPELPYTYWDSLWVKGSHGNTGIKMIGELVGREGGHRSDLLANFVLKAIIENPEKFFTSVKLAEAPIGKLFEYVEYDSESLVLNITKEDYLQLKLPHKKKHPIFLDLNEKKYYRYNETKKKVEEAVMDEAPTSGDGTMSANKMREALESWLDENHQHWLESRETSSSKIESDPELYEIVKKVCKALCVDFPTGIEIKFLYKFLERANLEFIQNVRTRDYSKEENKPTDWGSDSEIEPNNNRLPVWSKKVIVANGMLALILAYYASKVAIARYRAGAKSKSFEIDFKKQMEKKYTVNIDNTYFELEDCLSAAVNPPKMNSGVEADILFFDLNSFNAEFIGKSVSLKTKLDEVEPKVVVLDHTSTTTDKIRKAVENILDNYKDVYLILLVSSGLKNEQVGADNNPYGRMTIVTREDNKDLRDFIYSKVVNLSNEGLSNKALLPPKAHMVRHSYKDRGAAPRSEYFFNKPETTNLALSKHADKPQSPQNKLSDELIKPFAQMSLEDKKTNTPPSSVGSEPLNYGELDETYKAEFSSGSWKAKYISEEGGVSGIRCVFVVHENNDKYANCPSHEIRVKLVAEIRNILLITHNDMKQEKIVKEVIRRKKIYDLLVLDLVKSLVKLNKIERQELLKSFLTLFYSNMSQRDHGALETLIHRDVVTTNDPNMKYLLDNYSKMIKDKKNSKKFNPNIMEFCMGYLENVRNRNINEGEELLKILEIILPIKIFQQMDSGLGVDISYIILSYPTPLSDYCRWKKKKIIYLDCISDSSDTNSKSNHYNLIRKDKS